MDRFVTRAPTWQTLNYSSLAAQSLSENKTVLTKRTPSKVKRQKNPLQPKQLSETTQAYDFGKRLDSLFAFNQVVNAENINGNSNDSGLSSASSISPRHIEDENFTVRQDAVHNSLRNNLLLTPPKNHLGKLIFLNANKVTFEISFSFNSDLSHLTSAAPNNINIIV